ncbi:MAG TPA: beta-ketoacyl synthase N-terminal-like domain-containing protein, partial [Candidatus Nanopelagicales bacterium]
MAGSTRSIAIVGVGAVLPDAPDVASYWRNLTEGRCSIGDVPADRWNPELYYDSDPHAPDKTYSVIGGWVRDFDWAPLQWGLPVPPKVSAAMDRTQQWSVAASRQALLDYGYPERPLDNDRTAVVLGNAMAGELHYLTALRAYLPEYVEVLKAAPSFASLPFELREALLAEMSTVSQERFPVITEDSMPGELSNIIAGRVANLFNFHGPNFTVDAACASALAAIDAAVQGLEEGQYDAVITGGIDANMGAPSFIKFSAIGALSATGTRPYRDGADGFVMGEGAAVFLLKRLADAERDGDHIYAVLRGIGGSSDGKGKGITAPNPIGQEFAVSRAWQNAGLVPDSATYIEGHGTSTRVGDLVEVTALSKVFAGLGLAPRSIPLGSVKSNIGHLKSAAGSAGLLKAVLALDHKVLPPSLGDRPPSEAIDFATSPLYVNQTLQEWAADPGQVRSVGVSAFGFGGTNFHVVAEEYVPGRIRPEADPRSFAVSTPTSPRSATVVGKAPLRGSLVVGGATDADVVVRLREVAATAAAGTAPAPAPPSPADLGSAVRVAIDYGDSEELSVRAGKAVTALEAGNPAMWKALRNQGVFVGRGPAARVAFLYTGQGSQYVNMLATLKDVDPVVNEVIVESDRITTRLLGRPLSSIAFADPADPAAMASAETQLRQTEITQPAVLTTDLALTRLLESYGIAPDMVMGHSLGEYAALVAAGAMPFDDALEAVAARGHEMTAVSMGDNGLMAAVFAPLDEVQAVLDEVADYVVIANLNSTAQAVIGGSTPGVRAAMEKLTALGRQVVQLPVSHAFHTEIVAPAAEPLKAVLARLHLESPTIPLVGNVTGGFYPTGPNATAAMIDLLGRQIASPVQFVAGLHTLYDSGARVFVEVGPKRALHGMAEDVFGDDPEVSVLFTNHPKQGDVVSFNQALTGLYAAGLGAAGGSAQPSPSSALAPADAGPAAAVVVAPAAGAAATPAADDLYSRLGHVFADALAEGARLLQGAPAGATATVDGAGGEPVVVTGAGLALPGRENVFGDDNISVLLHGQSLIDTIPVGHRHAIVDKHITRLVKSEAGGGRFETIDSAADVMKLAGRAGRLDITDEYGVPEDLVAALDRTTMLAIGVGLDALRDAGIPLVLHYKTATTGRQIPDRWMLPEAYRDTTGVIFGSAFPGADALISELDAYHQDESVHERVQLLRELIARLDAASDPVMREDIERRLHELERQLESEPYRFDRKFLFRVLSMGHSQFAQYIGARGPNTQVNAACASTTQAVAIAEDWIRAGRCDRVVVVAADDVTSEALLGWVGAGFLASGAAATDEVVEDAALPFDRRRHGMLLGMGAAALVVEKAGSARERGIRPIAEVLASEIANSAFHGTRLDSEHIRGVMARLISTAEARWGVDRTEVAAGTVFVSHETYTPARGGSAQAEVDALRHVFGAMADKIVVANTKGFTGHAMGAGIEDVLAVKSLETGIVPPVPNHREIDPDLGPLTLSRGGSYPVRYSLRLGAGFGSQIAMTLYRAVPSPTGHTALDRLGYTSRISDPAVWSTWLSAVTGLAAPTPVLDHRVLRIRDDGPPVREPVVAPLPAVARIVPAAGVREPGPLAPPVAPPSPAPAAGPAAPAAAPAPVAAAVVAPPAPAAPVAPAAVAPAAPASAAVAAEAAAVVVDPVEAAVLAVVAAQTGYPTDMLDLDLDLEADLGIDTVKQ